MNPIARLWRNCSLSLVLLTCFLLALVAQVLVGHAVDNQDVVEAGGQPLTLLQYLGSGHFMEATFENWESEFLQMAMYVVLTVRLRQRGSAESRPVEGGTDATVEPGPQPWPVRAGGVWLWLYRRSLLLAFGALFAASFVLHLIGSWRAAVDQRLLEGKPVVGWLDWLCGAEFWFESFQNWQSEFLAVLALVLLTIWLRQDGSPQSKPVAAPNRQTGA